MARKSKVAQKREQIFWALFDCLAENGHETITIKRIAAKAGVPHGVIHYYFEKKADIVDALLAGLTVYYSEIFEKHLDPQAAPSDNLAGMLQFLVEAFVFDRRLNRVFYNLVQMGFERQSIRSPLRRLLDAYRENIRAVLEQAGAGVETQSLSLVVVALIEGLALQWMIDPAAFDRRAALDLVKQIVHKQVEAAVNERVR